MAWVTPVVEIAFGHTPFATSPTYTDISAYVMGEIATKQGRSTEFDDAEVGTMRLTLNNRDRRFDPTYAAGPYYGNLKQNVRIRLKVSGTVLFTGWVKGWPQTLDHRNGFATVELEAVDALGLLAQRALPPTPYQAVMLAQEPQGYWPLNDSGERTVIDVSGNDNHGTLERKAASTTVIKRESADDTPAGQSNALYLWGYAGAKLPPVFSGVTMKQYQALTFWFKHPPANMTAGDSSFSAPVFISPRLFIGVDDSSNASVNGIFAMGYLGNPVIQLDNTDYEPAVDQSFDGRWHMVYLAADKTNGLARLYIDGGERYTSFTTGAGDGIFDSPDIATAYYIGPGTDISLSYSAPIGLVISNVAFMHSDSNFLYNGLIADYLWDAAQGWAGQTISQRVTSLLDAAGWPSGLRLASYGGGAVARVSSLPGNALEALQTLTRVDGSAVLSTRAGEVFVRDRNELLAKTRSQTVQAAFSDVSGSTYRYSDVQPALDVDHIYNVVRASRVNGGDAVLIHDKTSIETYGPHSIELDSLNVETDLEVAQFARWFIDRYSAPTARINRLEVNVRYSSTVMTKVIDLWLGDLITVEITPLNVGSAQTYTQWIESVEHRINVSDLTWFTTYVTSPATVLSPQLFILNTSTLAPTGTHVLAQ